MKQDFIEQLFATNQQHPSELVEFYNKLTYIYIYTRNICIIYELTGFPRPINLISHHCTWIVRFSRRVGRAESLKESCAGEARLGPPKTEGQSSIFMAI